MTDRELIKWAKNNLQEVQKSKRKQTKRNKSKIADFLLIVNQVVTKKIEKKLQKNLVD